jgi:hypothetical protein
MVQFKDRLSAPRCLMGLLANGFQKEMDPGLPFSGVTDLQKGGRNIRPGAVQNTRSTV